MNLISTKDYDAYHSYEYNEHVHALLRNSEAGRTVEYHRKNILRYLTMDHMEALDKGRAEAMKDPYKTMRETNRQDIG